MRRVLVVVWVLQVCVLLMQADSSSTQDHTTKDRTTTATPSSQLYQDLPESLQNNLLLQAPAEQNAPINPKTKYIQLANNLPIYILPAYYSFSPPYSRNDIPVEMKFQVSFRVVFLEQLVCKYCNFDFAYTQTHWFQIYNAKDSKPMRDINFSPSFMFNYTKQLAFLGGYITTMRLGYIHLSNGERKDNLVVGEADIRNDGLSKDDPGWLRRSKSIDRFIAQIDWQRGRFGLSLRAWVPVGKHLISDMGDNDNLTSYIGFGDSLYEFNYSLTRAGSGLRLNF